MDIKTLDLEAKGALGIFDGEAARKGYALNKLCHSFNDAENRYEFLADQEAYCTKYRLNDEQRHAIRTRSKSDFVKAGGSLYFYGKLIRMFPEAGDAFAYSSTVRGKAKAEK